MSNRNSLLASSSREARRRVRDAEMRTHFFPPPCGYQEVDRKRKTRSGSTARNGSFTLNKYLLAIK